MMEVDEKNILQEKLYLCSTGKLQHESKAGEVHGYALKVKCNLTYGNYGERFGLAI